MFIFNYLCVRIEVTLSETYEKKRRSGMLIL